MKERLHYMSDEIMGFRDFVVDGAMTGNDTGCASVGIDTDEGGGEEKKSRIERWLKKIFIICSCLLAGELIWLFAVNPTLPLTNIEIKGIEALDRRVVLNQAGVTARTSFFSFNAVDAKNMLAFIPQVESVEIIKKFPDTVSIILQERKAAALALATVEGRPEIVVFDKNGVIFQIGYEGGLAIPAHLPILSGMVFENVRTGLRLPLFLVPLLKNISDLGEQSPQLLSVISEIHINKKTFDNYDLIIYPASSPVKIRMGAELKEESLRYMLLLLDVLDEKGIDVDEVDFRTGTASYTVKEKGEDYSG
jgi:cell division protein FtsQ